MLWQCRRRQILLLEQQGQRSMGKIFLFVSSLLLAWLSKSAYDAFSDNVAPLKPIEENPFWGSSEFQKLKEDTKVYPFKINVSEMLLKDLKTKLATELADFKKVTPPLEGIHFEYGFNTKYLQKVVEYWHTTYDWKAREKLLNQYPQFKTKIFGLDIHFQRVKSAKTYKKTVPLLVMHGWPGSFVEIQKMIPLLTDPANVDLNFELIIPSLPGYGFSDPAAKPGLGPLEMSQIFLKLMQRLGFEQFYVHGGDWGGVIAATMASVYPNNVKAMHSNACVSFHPRSILRLIFAAWFPSFVMTQEEVDRFLPLSPYNEFIARETGYLHIQATKPDTVGVGLLHSPSGLAAYILEKFSTWTNVDGLKALDGLLEKSFGMDDILDNVMIYWVTNTITTSMRLYSEFFGPRQFTFGIDRIPIHVPSGCILAGNDMYLRQSEWVLRDKYQNLTRFTLIKSGGHFLAMEHPDLLANDIIQFFNNL